MKAQSGAEDRTGTVRERRSQFELEWLGGPAASRLRRRRPGVERLPWGTLDLSGFTPEALLEARRVWTNGAFTEYASAAGFTALATALLESGAPIDLVAAAADCAVDEMLHAELAARLVMELGGAAPFLVDLEKVSPVTSEGARPLLRAAELALKISCVGESLSVPALTTSLRGADQPLPRAVLRRLLRDEGPHARIGDWFFAWAAEKLSAEDRAHLGAVARAAIEVYVPSERASCDCRPPAALGGVLPVDQRALLAEAVRTKVIPGLARHGIDATVQ
ncbi:MAG: ferritin-like domain-containing protein [Myxococcales bacterium]|nr:ferritin-like domain-containing protein [Myxococcales bacterium]